MHDIWIFNQFFTQLYNSPFFFFLFFSNLVCQENITKLSQNQHHQI